MNTDPHIIVIGRQYGGTGRKIGRAIAASLGIPYYDRELINVASARFGYDPKILDKADEKKPSAFRTLLAGKYGLMDFYPSSPMSRESLYDIQTRVIRSVCEEGSCVIVGRTADYIMRDHPGLLSVFIHAPEEWRARNIVSRGEAATMQEAVSAVRKADSDRGGYYSYFTGREWGSASNYHLTIDASLIDTQDAVDLILHYLKKSKNISPQNISHQNL